MIAKLTDAQRRALAIGLAVLALLFVVAIFALPVWFAHRHYDRALADYGDQLARHQRIAATREATEAKLMALRRQQISKYYLKNPNPAVAGSELQDIVRAAIESAGARLIAVQPPVHRDEGRYRQITLNVNISVTGPALRRMFHALENAQPLLNLDGVSVRQSIGGTFKPTPGVEPEMFVQFEVTGYAIGSGK